MTGIFKCGYSQPNLANTVIGLQNSDQAMKKAVEMSQENQNNHFQGTIGLLQIRLETLRKKSI